MSKVKKRMKNIVMVLHFFKIFTSLNPTSKYPIQNLYLFIYLKIVITKVIVKIIFD